jgi:hypothetical protein
MEGKDLHSHWIETTADDGKPLKINMEVRGEALYFIFDKTKEGVWAEGVVDVCKEKEGLSAEIAGKDIKVGPQAPRVIRWTMGGGATFHLKLKDADHLHVSTFGWSGDFVPNNSNNGEGTSPQAAPTTSPSDTPSKTPSSTK